MPPIFLPQRFSTGAILALRDHLTMSRDFQGCHNGGGGCCWHPVGPEMLLNKPQYAGQSHLGERPGPKCQQCQHCKTPVHRAQHRWCLPFHSNKNRTYPPLFAKYFIHIRHRSQCDLKTLSPGAWEELAHVPRATRRQHQVPTLRRTHPTWGPMPGP